MSPFQIPPAYKAYPRNNPGKTFFPKLMDSWLVLRSFWVILNQWTRRKDWAFKWFSKTHFVWIFPIRQEILNVSQIGKNIPWNLPTNFHPEMIATILQMYLLSLCALLSQQPHLFPICVVSTYNDFRTDLHRLCQIPRNCQCKWLLVSYSAPRTSASSLCFLRSFFYMGRIVSIE